MEEVEERSAGGRNNENEGHTKAFCERRAVRLVAEWLRSLGKYLPREKEKHNARKTDRYSVFDMSLKALGGHFRGFLLHASCC